MYARLGWFHKGHSVKEKGGEFGLREWMNSRDTGSQI